MTLEEAHERLAIYMYAPKFENQQHYIVDLLTRNSQDGPAIVAAGNDPLALATTFITDKELT